MELLRDIVAVLDQALQLGARSAGFSEQTRLLGDIPELDSMAVMTVLTELEEFFDIVVEDDEVSADTFATVGTLVDFIQDKTA